MDILFSVAGSGIWFAVGALAAWSIKVAREHFKRGHIRNFIGDETRLRIVVSNVAHPEMGRLMRIGRYRGHADFMRAQPANVLFSPTAEGAAIARLYLAFHQAARWRDRLFRRELQVHLETAQAFSPMDARDPFVCVGGPSLNDVSRQLIQSCIPQFDIRYPEHQVWIGEAMWREPGRRDGRLIEDYGFALCGRTPLGTPFIVLWGTYALGTLIAARAFLDNWNKLTRRERSKFKRREGLFLVAHAPVVGVQVVDPIEPVRPQPPLMVRDVV